VLLEQWKCAGGAPFDGLRANGREIGSRAARVLASRLVDPFAALAPFYDLDLEGYEDDVRLYEQLLHSGVRRVLELGCGTGRVAAPLARAGLEVTGVDISPAMLAIGHERAGALGVRLIEGDMRALDLGEQFDAVLVPLGGLQHLETVDDLLAGLGTVARHLAPEGLGVVDVEAPHAEDFTAGPQPLVEHWTREWASGGGAQVTKTVAVDARPAEGVREVTWHFDVQPAEGPLRRVTQRFTLRTLTPAEIALAARIAGLEVTGEFGSYDLDPYDDGAERLIVTLEHARERDA
jgi:SAM-dependent methyltransferase